MSEYLNQPQNEADDLGAFERQLRSLTPREPAFQLSSTHSDETHVFIENSPDRRSRSNNKVWVATLIASWSLGAAVGIAGTLVYSSFGTVSPRSEMAAVRDKEHESTSQTVVKVNDLGSSSQEARRDELQSDVVPTDWSFPAPWSFLKNRSSQSNSAQSILSPRNFAADLAFDSPNIITTNWHDKQYVGPTEQPETVLTAPPDNTQFPTPTNQRDLMRSLLQM